MTLSDKLTYLVSDDKHLSKEDVKEFIKQGNIEGENKIAQIKERHLQDGDNMFELGRIQGILWVLDKIDKLAGDDLI